MWSAAVVRRTLCPRVGGGWQVVRRGRQPHSAGGIARGPHGDGKLGQPGAVRNFRRPARARAAPRKIQFLTRFQSMVREITVQELKARRDRGEAPLVLDVREEWELQLARIPDVVHVPMNQVPARLAELSPDAETVV